MKVVALSEFLTCICLRISHVRLGEYDGGSTIVRGEFGCVSSFSYIFSCGPALFNEVYDWGSILSRFMWLRIFVLRVYLHGCGFAKANLCYSLTKKELCGNPIRYNLYRNN